MASPLTNFPLGFIVLYIGTIIGTTDGTSVTWFEPPPFEVISDHNLVHYASNTTKLPLASTNISLSWNFSLSGLFFISLNLRLNGEDIGGVPPAAVGQPGILSPFDQRFSLNWIPSEKVTLTISNVTTDDNGTFTCELTLFKTSSQAWKSIIPVQVLVPPAITNTSGNQTVTEGDYVTLNCEAAVGNPQPRISWTKVSDNSAVTFPLVISRQDQGFFRCTANNDVGNPATEDVFVTVHYPPNITHISGNQTVNQTDSVTLRCSADGNPAPRVAWSRVSDNSVVTFPLNITGKGDEGAYNCTADNDVKDSVSKDTFIIVQNYSPLKPSLLTDLSGNTAVVDSPFNLTCSAEANPPPSYRFYRDETSLDTSAVEVYTTLVSEKRSPVNYSCTPYNEYGEGPTGRITVKVLYKPDTVRLESNVTENSDCSDSLWIKFTCNVSDSNPPIIKYYLVGDDEGVSFSNSGMWIQRVSRGGKHVYSCLAQHALGNITSSNSVNFTVNVPASVQPIKNVSEVEGGNVFLYCNASGFPDPTVTWSGHVNKVIMGRWLNITNISRPEDKTNNYLIYQCHANNTCGDASRVASIQVLFKPVVKLVKNDTSENICIGTIVNLTCEADANPPVDNYTLYKNNEVVAQGQEIIYIDTLGSRGQYIYRCETNNSVGTGRSSNTTLTVGVPASVQPITNVSEVEGGNVSLYCNASGFPDPTVTWSGHVNKVIIGPRLNITNISRPEDNTNNYLIYQCHANNTCGDASGVASIEVFFKPVVELVTNVTSENICIGTIVNLTCKAHANPSVDTYTLYKNNEVVAQGQEIIYIDTLGLPGQYIYRCETNNSLGTGRSSDTTLTVGVPSSVQLIRNVSEVEGGNVSLYCNAAGVPDPAVTWSGDVNEVIMGRWLNITNISRPEDKRNNHLIYQCHANNTCGDASRVASIEVMYPPFATPKESRINVPVGSVQVISCHVLGNPPPNITWYKGDIVIDSRLNIHEKQFNITAISNETYICSANNSLGSATARVDVVVYVDVETKYVTMKITLTIRDMDCREFTEVLKERFRNQALRLLNSYGITDVKITIRCGSVIVDLELSFTRSVTVDQVVKTLKEAASKKDFGDFKVDPESIGETGKAVSPTEPHCEESFIKKADCSVNVVIVAVIAVVAVIVVAFVAGVIGWWIHKRRKCRKDPRIHHSESEVLHDQNDIEDGAYARVNGGYADSGPPSANGTAQPKEAGSNNTDVPAEQAAAAPPAYAVVDKSKKKDKDKQNIPDYAVVDKSKKKKKKPEVEDPYAEVEDPKKDKDKKTTDPSTRDYAMVDKSKKKKKETDENAYATVDKSKKSKKGQQKPKAPGEVLYADLGDFQPVKPLPTVSTSPEPLAPLKKPTPYQGTEYADITQFLKGNATLPEGQSTEMQPTYANAGGGQGAAANKEDANTGGEGDIEPKETPM